MATKVAIKKPEQKKTEVKKPDIRPGKGVALPAAKGGLPAGLEEMMGQDAGKGVSTKPEDNLVPMMAIIQDKTPVADKNSKDHVEGAEGGMIWLKNYAEPFVAGEDGIEVQHCNSYKAIVEWRPRTAGGGFIVAHPHADDIGRAFPDAKQMPFPDNPQKFKWMRKNGNELIDTRYEVVRVFLEDGGRLQYVIPFTSTGHTVAKGWNTLRGSFHLSTGEIAPSWSRTYRLRTKSKTNQSGTWFLFEYEDLGWLSNDDQGRQDYLEGLALYNAFNRGEKTIDEKTIDDTARGDQGGDGDKM